MLIALVPGLNNKAYGLKFGIKLQSIALAVLVIISSVPAEVTREIGTEAETTEIEWFGLVKYGNVFLQTIAFGVFFILLIAAYNIKSQKERNIIKKLPLYQKASSVFSIAHNRYIHCIFE